jgi:hypothetical protein
MYGASQSFTLVISPVCNPCSELDTSIMNQMSPNRIVDREYTCSVCDFKYQGGKFITSSDNVVDQLKILLKLKRREEKIDDILI